MTPRQDPDVVVNSPSGRLRKVPDVPRPNDSESDNSSLGSSDDPTFKQARATSSSGEWPPTRLPVSLAFLFMWRDLLD